VAPLRGHRPGAAGADRPGERAAALRRGLPAGFDGLQRAAGNRAVGQLLRAPSIRVREGSRLSAGEFAAALKGNANVPAWLSKAIGAKGGALTAGKVAAPKDRIWLFVEPLLAAFKAGGWDITTATSKIAVTRAKGKEDWRQEVLPDLKAGERLGSYAKVGPDELGFSRTRLHSESAEVIYGWTSPNEASSVSQDKRNMIVIVREIEVTAPIGKTKVFTTSADNRAEAILHEIAIHAGRIAQGLPDTHDDTSAVIGELVDQIGAFFRATGSGGALEQSPLTKEILAFVAAN
jgi:hypothetical protein